MMAEQMSPEASSMQFDHTCCRVGVWYHLVVPGALGILLGFN